MSHVSSKTVRTIIHTGGGASEVTTTTTIDNGDSRTVTVHGNKPGNVPIATPRSKVINPAITGHGRRELSHPRGLHARDAVPEGRGGASVAPSQDYTTIKNNLRGKLYEDPDFPPSDQSAYFTDPPPYKFEWKRPHEICQNLGYQNPEFISKGASRFDVRQGDLGDCWLLAAVASLSLHPELFHQVVPPDQSFVKSEYCGMFRFRFWQFGEWKEVLVDDKLPTYNNSLMFMHSTDKNEFWSALLEKAYAKLSGSYESLKGGWTSEALEDFTGGVIELFNLNYNVPKNLFDIMLKAFNRCSLIGCSTRSDRDKKEEVLPNGLVMGHAYSITGVKMVDIRTPGITGKFQLIRIRNPWGDEAEWNGPWSDESQELKYISQADRSAMGLIFDYDGEFWMSFQDFVKNFEKMEICYLGPQSLETDQLDGKPKSRWETCLKNGEWKKGLNAGGCREYLDTFWTNPQFRIKVVDPDEDDDENRGTIIIGLMQKNMRKRRKEGVEFYTIGYAIYQLKDENQGPLDVNFFKYNASVAKAPSFINLREVCGRHKLSPGNYVIIPSTDVRNQEAAFLMRIFSEKPYESDELDEQPAMVPTKSLKGITPAVDASISTLKDLFYQKAGVDLEIDAYELQAILNTTFKTGADRKFFKFDGFSIETSKSMVAMMDYDQSGKFGVNEFIVLWTDILLWKEAFKKFDQDMSGNFNSYELRLCLNSVGFKLSNKILNSLVMRFANKEGLVLFDNYILCCVRLKNIFETYKSQPCTSVGRSVFDEDTFIQCIMYA